MSTEEESLQPAGAGDESCVAATMLQSAEERRARRREELGIMKTMRASSVDPASAPSPEERGDVTEPLGTRDTLPSDAAMHFPSLEGGDERRMEDMIASRLFPSHAAPTKIGRYEIRRRLGKGGMGIVYEARDPELDRAVAIKLLLGGAGSPEQEERLRREARAMARVAHPNVAQVIEIGRHEGQTFVAIEYIDGQTLDRWAAEPRPWREVLDVYIQAGRGLSAAHGAGVIHRDFKPHNTMLTRGGVDEGRVKVLDFGLARAGAEAETLASADHVRAGAEGLTRSLTRTGAVMGTPAYMSPEQFSGGRATERSDQYSFAASLYEALYGQLPHAGETYVELLNAVLNEPARAPSSAAAREVPSWVQRIVLRGLSRDPATRFSSVGELCDALARDPRIRRRRAAVAVSVCAAIGIGSWGLARASVEPPTPCSGDRFALAGTWDAARREAVTRALLATGARYAEDTARRVGAALDAYAAGWSEMRVEACEANQRGEQSDAMLDLRMACLERRRAGVEALASALEVADEVVLEKASASAQGLPPIERCADVEALADEAAPEDPAVASAVSAARKRLAEAAALATVGRYDAALQRAGDELEGARALGFVALEAEAALQAGAIELERREGASADTLLSEAITLGVESRADRVVAEAMSRRVFVRASLLREAEQALLDEPLARAYAARYPEDGELRWLTLNNVGVAARGLDDHARARGLFEAAAAIEPGPTQLERAMSLLNLGRVELDMGEGERAAETVARARAIVEETLGPEHPLVGRALYREGLIALRNDQRARARERFEAALTIFGPDASLNDRAWPTLRLASLELARRELPAARARAEALERSRGAASFDASLVYRAKALLGEIYFELGDDDRAREKLEEARALALEHRGPEHFTTAAILEIIGEGYRRHGVTAEAIAALTESLSIMTRVKGPRHYEAAEVQLRLALAEVDAGRLDTALENALAARDVLRETVGEETTEYGRAARALALAHIAREELDAGVESLRTAERVLGARLDAGDPELARCRFELAELLARLGDDRLAEARPLAELSLRTYQSLGEGFAAERDELAAWLTARP